MHYGSQGQHLHYSCTFLTLVSVTVLRIFSFTFQFTYSHAWQKIIMDASFVEFLRAGGVNQQLRKELEPSELESECEFEREPGT